MSECKHEQTISICCKHGNMFWATFPDGSQQKGSGFIDGVSRGDYVNMTICVDCCVITSTSPEKLQEAITRYYAAETGSTRKMARDLLSLLRANNYNWKLLSDTMTHDDFGLALALAVDDPDEYEYFTEEEHDRIRKLYEKYCT